MRRCPQARSAASASRPSAGRSCRADDRRGRRSSRTPRCRARSPSLHAGSSRAPTRRRGHLPFRRGCGGGVRAEPTGHRDRPGRRAGGGPPARLHGPRSGQRSCRAPRSRGCRASGRGSTRHRRRRMPPAESPRRSRRRLPTGRRWLARRGRRETASTSCCFASSGTRALPTVPVAPNTAIFIGVRPARDVQKYRRPSATCSRA